MSSITSAPVVDLSAASTLATAVRDTGGIIALANGAVDPLHVGHVRYLTGARALADFLVVVGSFAVGLGVINLGKGNVEALTPRKKGWFNSIAFLR